MKKPDSLREREPRHSRRQVTVVSSSGTRRRFLRGMITHDLVQRGVDFDDAYAAAHAIRDRVAGRDEVTTAEIRDLITEQLETMLGPELPAELRVPVRPTHERFVLREGQRIPFSRGVLARSVCAAGFDLDRAYRLVGELEKDLRRDQVTLIKSGDLAQRVGDLLERFEGAGAARRYRLVRQIRHLPRPLVLYLGGASGTGKSTLSLELAPLLRIYQIISTDTVRQMMRMVFSPRILPAVHSSSFEPVPALDPFEETGRDARDDDDQLLIASFEEQATRVCVGVRAVVERAIAENMNILVEGVHLVPPLIPFADLEGSAFQIPLVLATPDQEVHRARFLARGRQGTRRAERYLEHYPAIRNLHEFILQQAETHDVPLVETDFGDPPVARTVRWLASLLQKRLPSLDSPPAPLVPSLLLIVDGLADRPVRSLGGRTPLQAAATPTFDRLAREGQCGLADPIAPGVVPDTASGNLALFGQSPLALKRGPVEAIGAGAALAPGDIALRGNFATLDEHQHVVDRRAGRIREESAELAKALDRMTLARGLFGKVEIRVRAATEHRLAIVLRGEGLSSAIQGSDPGDGAIPGPPLVPQPLDPTDEAAVETARLLAIFEQKARKILRKHTLNKQREAAGLPVANTLLTRGAGRIHRLLPLEEAGVPLRSVCIGGDRTVLGLAEWLGAETVSHPSMTANLDTDLHAKFEQAREALRKHDLVVVHVKGADIAAHDQRPDLKAAFLEKVDRHLGELVESVRDPVRIAVASDHATLSESGQHAADPLPVLVWGHGIEADDVEAYDETSVAGGALQRFPLQMLLGRLFETS